MLCKEIQLGICWGMNLICMCLSQLTVLTKSCISSGIFPYIQTYTYTYTHISISYAVQYKIHTGFKKYIVIHWLASSETNTPYIGLDRNHSRWLPKTNSIFLSKFSLSQSISFVNMPRTHKRCKFNIFHHNPPDHSRYHSHLVEADAIPLWRENVIGGNLKIFSWWWWWL